MGPSMTINLTIPDIQELKPRITVFGVGGAGGNAVNNMIASGLSGVDFVCANTDAQALSRSAARTLVQLGNTGRGAGSNPEVARAAAEDAADQIRQIHGGDAYTVIPQTAMIAGTCRTFAPEVRDLIKFRHLDLRVTPWPLPGVDIVFS